ncbi:MAG: DNA translocase FtsK 4TM domain-containing protein [Hyphomicrobiaceae bacterium]|nr:DNA translocase FtsK 4TM domain-containing protein [Hyphomicrobiaceae bacterium]
MLLLVVAITGLSLVTWSISDPSLTHATSGVTHNMMGALGAIVSDLLLQTFGFASLVLLVVPLFWGLALVSSGPGAPVRSRSQLFFFPLAALAFAGAVSALPVVDAWPLHHGYGGILGDTAFTMAAKVLGLVNQSRGGIAAGFVLALGASIFLLRSLGISFDELVAAVRGSAEPMAARPDAAPKQAYVDQTGRIEPQLTLQDDAFITAPTSTPPPVESAAQRPGWMATSVSQAFAIARAKAQHGVSAVGDRARSIAASYSGDTLPDGRGEYGQPYAQPDEGAGWPQHGSSAHINAAAHESHVQPQGYGTYVGRPAKALGEDFVDSSFDVTTEEASRAIARRFAPACGVPQDEPLVAEHIPSRPTPARAELPPLARPQPAVQPIPAPHPMPIHGAQNSAKPITQPSPAASVQQQRQKSGARNALFGGLTFRGQSAQTGKLPPLSLLKKPVPSKAGPELTQTVLRGNARLLEDVLGDFGVKGEVRDIRPGPVVTLFELEPARGTKSSRVIGLADDIARSMSATAVRVAVVPGRNAIGIELPNVKRDTVLLREILESDPFRAPDAALPVALGKSIGGDPIVADLARMPHLLVAGTTGSGKSVGVNAMILSLLARHSPDDCRFLMIDPKMLELSIYNGIPHLLAPVVTDPHKAVNALNWAVAEMEERYKRMAKLSVRNIDVFNNRVRNAKKRGEMIQRTVQTGFDRRTGEAIYEQEHMELETMPYIVVVIDEFADLMLVAGKEVEASVQRLAQMARAAGIHIIMATQRPSVDVITGTIKANFPTRISFKVASKIDSRTILNEQGAEQLLGQGDMLYASGSGQVTRVHGAFVSDEEVEAVANFLRSQGAPRYVEGITDEPADAAAAPGDIPHGQGEEDLYDRAVAIVLRDRKASTSYLQRRLSIGYNRAADLIERMEADGLISAANNVGKREILADGTPPEPAARAAGA